MNILVVMVFVSTSDVLKSMHIVLVSVFWLSVLSINCIGVTVLIPYMLVFVVTVLQIFLVSKDFGYCPSMVTIRLIDNIVITIGMTISGVITMCQ